MDILHYFILGLAATAAGFVDSVVGGGGLIQVPTLFATFPNTAPTTLLGTNKIASVVGTSSAAYQYAKRIPPVWTLIIWGVMGAAAGSWFGAQTVALISPATFKPLILILLVAVAIYTFMRKDFGEHSQDLALTTTQSRVRLGLIGLIIGYYDGFLGPGTGSFFIFLLIRYLGCDFVSASATAKILNVATNLAAISSFVLAGSILWKLGALMALCNLTGAVIGSHVALSRGAGFVRKLFLCVVTVLILKMAYDLL